MSAELGNCTRSPFFVHVHLELFGIPVIL
jgi:hypothetical protein